MNRWLKKKNLINWKIKPKKEFLKKNNYYTWFPDGELNVYENCILDNLKYRKNKNAIIFIDENNQIKKFSYLKINNQVSKVSFYLTNNLNFNSKTKIMIHGGASFETIILMLSCTRLGIHFSVIFEELEIDAIKRRLKLFTPDYLFTNINFNFSVNNNNLNQFNTKSFFKKINQLRKKNYQIKLDHFKSEKSLFTLFTSGSTGEPKGITHGTGGYLFYSKYTTQKQFGCNKNSVMMTASDSGWINGHTYALFGPLSIGATTVILAKPTMLLNKLTLDKIKKLNISIFYLPVTLIRMMKAIYVNLENKEFNFKTLGSMGEPLANEVALWFVNNFSKLGKPIINTYFQTETGGIICSHKFNQKVKKKDYGSVGLPCDNLVKINKLSKLKKKEIKIIKPWPGMMKKIINGNDIYKKYFDYRGNFKLFDLATKSKNQIFIHGRSDDVINVRGHRIGSGEIESVVLEISKVVECSAVAIEDYLEGNVIYLFVVSNKKNIGETIENKISSAFGNYVIPKKIFFVKELPKTRSGKIMRRILREIVLNKSMSSDISTMLNPEVINKIKDKINEK